MRCLTLANSLRLKGAHCRFISQKEPGNLIDLIKNHNFEAIELPLDNSHCGLHHSQCEKNDSRLNFDWITDATQTLEAIGQDATDILVVDHYGIDARWESFLRQKCKKIMVIDDLANRQHDCDLLLDQNLIANFQNRYIDKIPKNCGLMLGPEYALLQPIYADLHRRIPPRYGSIHRILVYFGGADTNNITGMTIAAFSSIQNSNLSMDVVINPLSPHFDSIQRMANIDNRIRLHEHLPNLALLMVKADVAIGAGGATSWERCCLGLPSLIITLANNQIPVAAELDKLGLAEYLGHNDTVDINKLSQVLQKLIETGLQPSWSQKCSTIVDGRGADRVTDFMLLDAQTPLRARFARLDDENKILLWANDKLVRDNAFNSKNISPEIHRKWFYERLRKVDKCKLYIIETENALPIGQVRFDKNINGWEISYLLDPCARGRGLGAPLLRTAISAFKSSTQDIRIFARVKDKNTRSQNVLKKLDFQIESQSGETIFYQHTN